MVNAKKGFILRIMFVLISLMLLSNVSVLVVQAEGTDAWLEKISISTARYGLRAAELNGKIYVIGGTDNYTHLNTVELLDPINYQSIVKAKMPTARHGMGVIAANGKIYAIGGLGSGHINAVEEYDPVLDSWFTKANMPTARDGLAVVTVRGKIYAIGGVNASFSVTGAVEMYDPLTNAWSTKATMRTPRAFLGAAVVNGKIYAIGGQNSSWATVNTVEMYDPASNTWETKASMPTGRYELGVTAMADKIYAIGGSVGSVSSDFRNTVEEYNTQTNTWAIKASLPTGRTDLAAVSLNNRVYAIGGYNGNPTAKVEEFFPIFNKGGYWTFSGGYTYDSSGNNNTGTFGGSPAPARINGVLDYAFTFDGQNYIQVPDNPSLDAGTGDFSIVCWFMTTSTKTINQLVEKRAPGGGVGYSLCLYTGRLLLQLNDPASAEYNFWGGSSATAYNDGKWHCLAVTVDRDSTTGLQMYLDNKLVQTFNPTVRPGNLDNSEYFYMGKHETSSGYNYVGSLDEVGFYKRLLTMEEISALYQNGYNNLVPQISFYYNMYDYGFYERSTTGGYGSYSIITGVIKDPLPNSVQFYYTTTASNLQAALPGSGNGYYSYTWSPTTWYKPNYSVSGNWYMPSLEFRASNNYGSARNALHGYVLLDRLGSYQAIDSTFIYWDEGVNSFRDVGTGSGAHGQTGVYNCLAYAVGNTKNWEWPWGAGTPNYTQLSTYMKDHGYPTASTSVMPFTRVIYYSGNHFTRVLTWDANGNPLKVISKWGGLEVIESGNYDPFKSVYGKATYYFK
ncbi:MAG TPA: LamG-like jellyroll fold domain-containing protein [Bacillota bacterium]|nr:LamG-like jellyroll fold domain-containing protein [Bacillota bacterium]